MDHYVNVWETGTAAADGRSSGINMSSKIGQVATARIATDNAPKGILIYAVCPGLMNTAASRPWFDNMKGVPSLAASPVKQDLEVGLLVTANSDDPSYFGGYLNDNYRRFWSILA